MNLRRVYTLQNQVSNKQTSLYCLVLLALSHQLYSLRGLHIGNISSPTVTITKRSSFNYFPLFLSTHLVVVTSTIFVVANTNYYLRHLIFFSRLLIHKIIYTRFDETPQTIRYYICCRHKASFRHKKIIIYDQHHL